MTLSSACMKVRGSHIKEQWTHQVTLQNPICLDNAIGEASSMVYCDFIVLEDIVYYGGDSVVSSYLVSEFPDQFLPLEVIKCLGLYA